MREAIRTLASTRVIRTQQGRSSVIKPPEQWSPLEPRLLRARGQASGEPLELPRRLMEADVDRFVENDLAFHATLFKAVDNVFLDALFEPLASVLRTLPSVR